MNVKVVLCRHKGFLAGLVRLVTGSYYDHIAFKDEHGRYIDLHPELGIPIWHTDKLWDEESVVASVYACDIPYDERSTIKYSYLFNLNYITHKLLGWAPFKGDNCVSFVNRCLGGYRHMSYMCPEEMALLAGLIRGDYGQEG